MSELVAELGGNLAIYKVRPDEIREQDINARVMPPEMFDRLTETIKRDGRLESLPFAVKRQDDLFELISGHHRVRASRSAALDFIYVIADSRELSRSEVVAKQVAHNRINGTDDPDTLRVLFEDITRVEDLFESYLSEDEFDDVKQLETVDLTNIAVDFPWKVISFVFLPKQLEQFEQCAQWVDRKSELVGVCDAAIFERFCNAAMDLGRYENIKSVGAIVARMTEIAYDYLKEHGADDDAGDEGGDPPAAD